MITQLKIKNFKCLTEENLIIKPLTILSGVNSSGKSTVIQSILTPCKILGEYGTGLSDISTSFSEIRNIYQNAKELNIEIIRNNSTLFSFVQTNEKWNISARKIHNKKTDSKDEIMAIVRTNVSFEENIYYLSANRNGTEFLSRLSHTYKSGTNGEFLLGTFELEKSRVLIDKLISDQNSFTLSTQLNYWLSYILSIPLELITEKRSSDNIEVRYKSDKTLSLIPSQLGSGVGYLTKILILCLRAKPNDLILIENPEIHLHPAAQAKLADFFIFIANAGIQVIIETHCEHLIYKLQYNIYKKRIDSNQVTLFYKQDFNSSFQNITLENDGKFKIDFPTGFFDATINEIIEME